MGTPIRPMPINPRRGNIGICCAGRWEGEAILFGNCWFLSAKMDLGWPIRWGFWICIFFLMVQDSLRVYIKS